MWKERSSSASLQGGWLTSSQVTKGSDLWGAKVPRTHWSGDPAHPGSRAEQERPHSALAGPTQCVWHFSLRDQGFYGWPRMQMDPLRAGKSIWCAWMGFKLARLLVLKKGREVLMYRDSGDPKVAWSTIAGLPGQGCLMLKDPKHPMTWGYITDDVFRSIRRCLLRITLQRCELLWENIYVKYKDSGAEKRAAVRLSTLKLVDSFWDISIWTKVVDEWKYWLKDIAISKATS